MCVTKMSLVLLFFIFMENVEANVNTNIVNLPNNVTITTKSAGFKRHMNIFIAAYERIGSTSTANTVVECGTTCISIPRCRGFNARKERTPITCDFIEGNLDTIHYYVRTDFFSADFYELENMCTLNPFICKHGSVCIPNFGNNTYHCDWCFPPYYGKHCNLTDGVISNLPIPTDILSGKKLSCRTLRRHFGPLIHYGIYEIHPWRDGRKIKVECSSNGETLIMDLKSQQNGDNFTTLTTLDDLVRNQRVTTSVLNMFYKLTRFEQLQFGCRRNANVRKLVKTRGDKTPMVTDVLKYFIGESNTLPRFCHTQSNNLQNVTCTMALDEKWSTGNVPFESRNSEDIVRFGNSALSFSDGRYGCFDQPTEYMANDHYYIWAY